MPVLLSGSSRGLFFITHVSSPVATFEQSDNVTIAHLAGAACYAMRSVASATAPSAHVHGTNGQSYPGRILCVHELRLYVL